MHHGAGETGMRMLEGSRTTAPGRTDRIRAGSFAGFGWMAGAGARSLPAAARTILLAATAALAALSGAAAQEAGPTWRLEAGGGAGLSLSGHDLSESGDPAGVAHVGLEHRVSHRVWLGVGWTGAWLDGAPGGDSRHALALTTTFEPGGAPVWLRLAAGFALSTIADVDGPPEPPAVGDVVVAIGSTMGASLVGGLGLDLPLGGSLSLAPSADLLLQRVEGRTLTLIGLGGRLRLGL